MRHQWSLMRATGIIRNRAEGTSETWIAPPYATAVIYSSKECNWITIAKSMEEKGVKRGTREWFGVGDTSEAWLRLILRDAPCPLPGLAARFSSSSTKEG